MQYRTDTVPCLAYACCAHATQSCHPRLSIDGFDGSGQKKGTRMMQEWITRLAGDERRRDAVIAAAREVAAHDAEFVLEHGQRLIDELGATIVADVECFRQEFAEDDQRQVTVSREADGGFEVRRVNYPLVALTVAPHWTTSTVACTYRFTPTKSLPTREDRFVLVFTPDGGEARFKHQNSGRVFAGVGALSEYLLTPLFTGRPSLQ